ncbi:MAG: hypothetical protein OEX02_14145 [Cyclobacteriaceae bacterium]|nr:hypothetical protein [Cyclobacteriaceae bacterium]
MKNKNLKPARDIKNTFKALNSYKKNFGLARCNLELLLHEHRFVSFDTALHKN